MGYIAVAFAVIIIILFAVKLIEHASGRQIIPNREPEEVSMWKAIEYKEDHRTGRNLSHKYTYDRDDLGVSDDLRKVFNKSLDKE
jgi:hypothetical protein